MRGLPLSTLEVHMLGATAQGFLWKQHLKSGLKIPQRGEYVKLKILHVKLHKKIGVLHFEYIRINPYEEPAGSKNSIQKWTLKCFTASGYVLVKHESKFLKMFSNFSNW